MYRTHIIYLFLFLVSTERSGGEGGGRGIFTDTLHLFFCFFLVAISFYLVVLLFLYFLIGVQKKKKITRALAE